MDINPIHNNPLPEKSEKISRMKINIKKVSMVLSILVLVGVATAGFFGWRAGLFSSAEALSAFLSGLGAWAPIAFLLLQILQIVIPIIPGGVILSVGVVAFGPVYGFIYNYVGMLIGSYIAFVFARRFGLPLIKSIIPEKTFAKYIGWLDNKQDKFNKLFALAIFLPFFPDDLLCMLAGVSKMKTSTFWLINVVLKIPFLLPYSFGVTSILRWIGM